MKKFLLILISISLFLCACNGTKTAEISDESGLGRFTGIAENVLETLNYPAVYVRTDNYTDDTSEYPRIVTISTRAELEKYTSDYENSYDFTGHAYSISFYDAVTKYDAAYFESSSVIMVILKEDKTTYTHSNNGFTSSKNGYKANIIRFTHAEDTDGKAVWHIIFEVPKSSPVLDGGISVNILEEKVLQN